MEHSSKTRFGVAPGVLHFFTHARGKRSLRAVDAPARNAAQTSAICPYLMCFLAERAAQRVTPRGPGVVVPSSQMSSLITSRFGLLCFHNVLFYWFAIKRNLKYVPGCDAAFLHRQQLLKGYPHQQSGSVVCSVTMQCTPSGEKRHITVLPQGSCDQRPPQPDNQLVLPRREGAPSKDVRGTLCSTPTKHHENFSAGALWERTSWRVADLSVSSIHRPAKKQ